MAVGQQKVVTDSVDVSKELIHIKNCIYKFHRQHQNGTAFSFIGIGITAVGAGLYGSSVNGVGGPIMAIGAFMVLTGELIKINSYKHLKQASLSIAPGGAIFRYRFK